MTVVEQVTVEDGRGYLMACRNPGGSGGDGIEHWYRFLLGEYCLHIGGGAIGSADAFRICWSLPRLVFIFFKETWSADWIPCRTWHPTEIGAMMIGS